MPKRSSPSSREPLRLLPCTLPVGLESVTVANAPSARVSRSANVGAPTSIGRTSRYDPVAPEHLARLAVIGQKRQVAIDCFRRCRNA
jgi:hypothetical protein